jgi:hypothetical protein
MGVLGFMIRAWRKGVGVALGGVDGIMLCVDVERGVGS